MDFKDILIVFFGLIASLFLKFAMRYCLAVIESNPPNLASPFFEKIG